MAQNRFEMKFKIVIFQLNTYETSPDSRAGPISDRVVKPVALFGGKN